MNTHIIDALRPESPALDPDWEAETVRAILEGRTGAGVSETDRGGRMMRVALVAAAVVALIGGAVVARNALPSDDVRPAKPTEDKIQTVDPSKATKLKLGDTLEVVTELPKTFNGDQLLFSGFAGDNVVVGSTTSALDEGAQGVERLAQSHPVSYNLDSKALTLLDDRSRPEPTQILDVSGNESTVVWVEGVGVSADFSEFTIYSYDRRSKKVTTIGEFNDPDGQIVYNHDLALAGDRAYFSTFAAQQKKGQQAVYAMPVDGSSPPSVIAQGGNNVRISGDTLTYGMGNPQNEEEAPTYFTYDLSTGNTAPAPVSAHASDPDFCGAEITKVWETWCVGDTVLTIKEVSGRTTTFSRFPVSFNPPHDVIALGSWTGITVAVDDGQLREFLVDLDTKEVRVFPDNTSFTALSPDRSTALISSFASKGPGPQRIVRIPD
ncbi:hypothetical protein GCM10022234_16400 [Aeromicrobium panaciterrae]|uniref:hypothetical protein n=1 Tax=Aeromicrobium panaciterrae TaxID=363861 RepID=UPI0031E377FF